MRQSILTFQPKIDFLPFPIGISHQVFDESLYRELVETYPPIEIFRHVARGKDNRYALNDVSSPKGFTQWIESHSAWKELHGYLSSRDYIFDVFDVLKDRGVDLGIRKEGGLSAIGAARRAIGDIVKRRRAPRFPRALHSRFEFGMLPGDGGFIWPHTDAPNTLVTMVITMIPPGEWKDEWGGQLEACRPKGKDYRFNWSNRFVPFDEVEPIREYPYKPNQCMFFIKTYDSWHTVRPMSAPKDSGAMRKTITVVIEQD